MSQAAISLHLPVEEVTTFDPIRQKQKLGTRSYICTLTRGQMLSLDVPFAVQQLKYLVFSQLIETDYLSCWKAACWQPDWSAELRVERLDEQQEKRCRSRVHAKLTSYRLVYSKAVSLAAAGRKNTCYIQMCVLSHRREMFSNELLNEMDSENKFITESVFISLN